MKIERIVYINLLPNTKMAIKSLDLTAIFVFFVLRKICAKALDLSRRRFFKRLGQHLEEVDMLIAWDLAVHKLDHRA